MASDPGQDSPQHNKKDSEPMPIQVITLKIRFVVEADGEEFYAYCPDLPGLHVGGTTQKEALKNGREAVEAYLQSLIRHKAPIPVGVQQECREYSLGGFFRELWSRVRLTGRHSVVEEITLPVAA